MVPEPYTLKAAVDGLSGNLRSRLGNAQRQYMRNTRNVV